MQTHLRQILHIDLDSFFVAVEQLLDKSLLGKPVIIGGSSNRGVVSTCSYEARKFGVHSAMPIAKAKQLCKEAIFINGNYANYSKYSAIVTQIIADNAPLFEKASIDEHYIDLTGMDIYYNSLTFSKELRKKIILESGLPASFGLSTNKTISKIATDYGKPNGETYVSPGKEKEFLAPMSVQKIPFVGSKSYLILQQMGIEKIAQLQEVPLYKLQQKLGEFGTHIWHKAHGECKSEVVAYHERKSMSNETTFEKDTADIPFLKRTIAILIDELAFTLRKENKLTGCITIKIKYGNFEVKSLQTSLNYTNSDKDLTQQAYLLLQKIFTEKAMYRLIGVKFSNLVYGHNQIDLFNANENEQKVNKAVDDIRKKYGLNAISKAIGK